METLIMHPKNEDQLTALKSIAVAFKIDFEAQANRDETINFMEKRR